MPPSSSEIELPLTVQLVIVNVADPSTFTPPPSLLPPLPVIVMPFIASDPFVSTRTPPPSPCTLPPVIVKLLNVTLIAPSGGLNKPGSSTSNTRSTPPPFTIVPAAFPLIVSESVMSRSPVAASASLRPLIVSVIVPAGRLITSAPDPAAQSDQVAALLFALMIASRSVQTPLFARESPVPVTVIVFAHTNGASTTSSRTADARESERIVASINCVLRHSYATKAFRAVTFLTQMDRKSTRLNS